MKREKKRNNAKADENINIEPVNIIVKDSNDNDSSKSNLTGFLAGRFLAAVFVAYISSNLIDLIFQVTIPMLSEKMHFSELLQGSETRFGAIFYLSVFLRIIIIGLPDYIQSGINYFASKYLQLHVIPALAGNNGNSALSYTYMVFISLFFLVLFFISILPYIFSFIWYFAEISNKVKYLRMQDEMRRNKYEQDRNLMIADLAHDIKTPITSVVGYSRALTDDIVPNERKVEYLKTINSKAIIISELIDLMFEYVILDSKGYSLELKEHDVTEIVLECVAEAYTDFENAGINLIIDIPEAALFAQIDDKQFRRVINNLLSNAIKYKGDGSKVLVRIKQSVDDQDILIVVSDDGPKIDKEVAEHIFEPFYRGDKTRPTTGGSGLGLSIASRIIALHKGELKLITEVDGEMTKAFVVEIPRIK